MDQTERKASRLQAALVDHEPSMQAKAALVTLRDEESKWADLHCRLRFRRRRLWRPIGD